MQKNDVAPIVSGAAVAAAGPLVGQLATVVVCALWGALVALTHREADPAKTLAQNQRAALAFVFACFSFGVFFPGLIVYFAQQYVQIETNYLLGLSAFVVSVMGDRWPFYFGAVLDAAASFIKKRGE